MQRAGDRDGDEPDQHHRAEERRDPRGAAALHREQRDQDDDRERQHVMLQRRRRQLQALHRRQHRDRRRDHRVAEEHRRADDAEQQHETVRRPSARVASAVSDSVPPSPLLSERSRTSTYLIVTTTISAHRIIDSTPSTVSRVTGPDSAARHHRDAEGVERARADIAIDHADAAERQRPEAAAGMRLRRPAGRPGGWLRLQCQS